MKTAIAAAEPPEPDRTPAATSVGYTSGGVLPAGLTWVVNTAGPAESVVTFTQWAQIRTGGR
jgi:hypothetical protein